jgi:hypothetical protein
MHEAKTKRFRVHRSPPVEDKIECPTMTTDRIGTRKASVLPYCRYPEERTPARTGRLTLLGLEALLLLLLLALLLT